MSIDDLYRELSGGKKISPEYEAKMLHKIPDAPVVDREKYILEQCKDKIVLNLGCASGELHEKIQSVARMAYGIDKEKCNHGEKCLTIDFERFPHMSSVPFKEISFDVIVAGEILEHLSAPGPLLEALRYYICPILITVPNALSVSASNWTHKGIENVNIDHVSWYSYRTLRTLIEKCGYKLDYFAWYGGEPFTAEGIIFLISSST